MTMKAGKKYQRIRALIGDKAEEIAIASGINQATLSRFENGSVELNDAQLERLRRALIAAAFNRMTKLRKAHQGLNEGIPQKETGLGAGAREAGLESGDRCEERPNTQ